MRRAWTYLQERFPLPAHGPLVAAFAGGIVCATAALRAAGGTADGPGWPVFVVAVTVALGAFFQLRVADEWKDADRDRRFQPERPVPRGLVTLRELTVAALAVAAVQMAAVVWLDARLALALVALWVWIGLMTADFFAPQWLDARPLAMLALHGLVVPVIDGFAITTDLVTHGGPVPLGVLWLVGVGFFGGNVVEVGRKIRATADERPGVATYSAAWGRRRAAVAWTAAVALSATFATGVLVAQRSPVGLVVTIWLAVVAMSGITVWFIRRDEAGAGKRIEAAAGVWTLALYLTVGPLALWLR